MKKIPKIHDEIRGSHWMSGSCTQDYGSVTIMPIAGKLVVDPLEPACSGLLSPDKEKSSPYSYEVMLNKYNVSHR
ncbi:MAG: hypothetical protein U5K79_23675 [Cyclobacteriaceae bacterium]|nr:hypothetical protein [Cyclobacteriaceae bacterium]